MLRLPFRFSLSLLAVFLFVGILMQPAALLAQRRTFTQELILDDNQNLPTPATITLRTPAAGTPGFASWTMTLPESPPSSLSVLTSNSSGQLQWIATIPQSGGWLLNGNSLTTPGTDFLGTTDNVAFQIHVNNLAATPLPGEGNGRVMRFEPNNLSPNILGGFKGNSVTAGARGITIGGGGANANTNRVTSATADFATIAGGYNNLVSGRVGTVIGGGNNQVTGDTGTAMGNDARAVGAVSTAFGSGTRANGTASVAMGQSTTASGTASVAMGQSTTASGTASVAMGQSTTASGTASIAIGNSSTAGGASNTIALGQFVNATAANAIAIGQGVSSGSRLVNNVASSLMVGFNSTSPSLFVGPNSGNADSRGNVGIGTSTPASRLVVQAEDNLATKSTLNVTDNTGTSALFITNDRRIGMGGVVDPGLSATNKARVHIHGLTNGIFGVGRPITYALVIDNANGDPLLRVRDDGRVQLRTASADFSGLTSRGSIGPALDNTYDLGSCGLQWRDLYLGNNLIFKCTTGSPDLNGAEMSFNSTNAYLDFRVKNGTTAPATALVVAENNRRVGITDGTGTAFSTTGPQGALDIRSTTGALIIPRMTFAQRTALTSVQDGSMVYQTDNDPTATCPGGNGCEGFYFYESGAWVRK